MIEQITDKERLATLLENSHRRDIRDVKDHFVSAKLQPKDIEFWKKEGYFRFVKSQLQNINMKFACTQDNDGSCVYFFILPTKKLKNRVFYMLLNLWNEKQKKPLVKCGTVHEGQGIAHDVSGEVKACPLF